MLRNRLDKMKIVVFALLLLFILGVWGYLSVKLIATLV